MKTGFNAQNGESNSSSAETEALIKSRVESTLAKHHYQVTEASKELGVPIRDMYNLITQYGIRLSATPNQDFDPDLSNDLKKAIALVEDLVALCEHCADFSNGVTDPNNSGIDEGRVKASAVMYRIEKEIKRLKDRNNLW